MIQVLPLIVLLLSGLTAIFFNFAKVAKYSTFLAMVLFLANFFLHSSPVSIEIFHIEKLKFNLSMSFNRVEILICVVVCSILFCLHMAKKEEKNINKILGILNVFAFFMCSSIVSTNLFQFFIGIEALGIISAILVAFGENSLESSSKIFAFNKFASLIFLIAISLIAINFHSFQFSDIKAVCNSGNIKNLAIPALLLLISCFCKGAQLPFSPWLLDATKADIFTSIFLHSATLVSIGVIFIAKCYFIFEAFPYLKQAMIYVGLTTALWMACCSLFHGNIKKIMACLTASTTGTMFIACGLGEYSLALLCFICHAFFKSMLFLSFSYVIRAMSNEQNMYKMGGLSKLIPNITDIVWISFLSAVGFPFFVGFFAKISFLGSLQLSNRVSLVILSIIINIISIITILRMIMISIYGKSRADDITLSRVSSYNSLSISSVWILIIFAVFGSFIFWSIYEWGALHFGYGGIVYSREFFDYFIENMVEMAQIGLGTMIVLILKNKKIATTKRGAFFIDIFKNNKIYKSAMYFIIKTANAFLKLFANINEKFFNFINYKFFKSLYGIGITIGYRHRRFIFSHALWISLGLIISILSIFLRKQ